MFTLHLIFIFLFKCYLARYFAEGFFGGKQDPYGEMIVGDGSIWKHVTDVQQDAGVKANWSIDASTKITIKDLKEGMFTVRAKDEDPKTDKVIGKAAVDLSPVLSSLNEWVDVEGDLAYKESLAGHYAIRMRYRTVDKAHTADVSAVSSLAHDESQPVDSQLVENAVSERDATADDIAADTVIVPQNEHPKQSVPVAEQVGTSDDAEVSPPVPNDIVGTIEVKEISAWDLKNTGMLRVHESMLCLSILFCFVCFVCFVMFYLSMSSYICVTMPTSQ